MINIIYSKFHYTYYFIQEHLCIFFIISYHPVYILKLLMKCSNRYLQFIKFMFVYIVQKLKDKSIVWI